MKVFVTGGSGYLGTAVLRALHRHGHTVHALARSENAARAVRALGATPVRGALDDLAVLNDAAAQAEAVVHLAQARTGEEDLAAATAMQDGIGAGPYLHTGGTWVYGDTHGVVGEDAPWDPPALVAWRRPVEDAVLARASRGGRPVVIRPGLLYGDGNGLIDIFFVRPALEAGAVAYIGDGTQHWALVHVEDLAGLYVAALRARPGSVYAGVGGSNPTAREVAEALSHGAGLDGRTVSLTLEQARADMGPIADAFALDQQLTPQRARDELGWAPAFTDPTGVLARG
ncbi:NAD-dependent epimerase/dehydratase family protein [Streptomyces sp. NPDC020983]|uniref:NAD-dependent epimerase/dehydratase family protein n=1 Tax=Streptomyces sp. NPDC020983 TaxID=3365106 RepID=UPI0037B21278